MRKLTRLLATSLLLLPGCILVASDDGWDGDWDDDHKGHHIEKRLASLERRMEDMERCAAECMQAGAHGEHAMEPGKPMPPPAPQQLPAPTKP